MLNRLRFLLATVFGIGTAGALLAAWLFANAGADQGYDRLLASAAVQIAESITIENGVVDVMPPEAAFETLAMSTDDRIFYAVRDPQGRVLTGFPGIVPTEAPNRLAKTTLVDGRLFGVDVREAVVGRYVSLARPGWVSVVVAQTRRGRQALAWSLMTRMGALIISVGALGFIAALVAAHRALRPLSRIGEALNARKDNDLTPLVVDSPRETLALVYAINDLVARMGERSAKLQSFAGLAAHQVRTPIAALLAQVELLRGESMTAGVALRADRLRDRLISLGRLTNQLLDHAMVSYRAELPRQTIDLVETTRSALRDSIPRTSSNDIELSFGHHCSSLLIVGDEVILREAITNLIHNAAVHGARTRLSVVVKELDGFAVVAVEDDGAGIAAEQWHRVCSPFAAARDERPGAGLGLSIVCEIARIHGGDVTSRFPSGGGFEVSLRLPFTQRASE